MQVLFWIAIALVFYCYAGYPVLLMVTSRLRPWAVRRESVTPTMTVIIVVYNEQDVIEEKLENLLKLDYPRDRIRFLIGSDASADETDEIVSRYSEQGIELRRFDQRRGKIAVLNDLFEEVSSECVFLTDARQRLEPDVIRLLAENFADPNVGSVSGELEFLPATGGTGKGVGLYWRYEKALRRMESVRHSMLGATGAIYMLRASLLRKIPNFLVLDDMYLPMMAVLDGYRAIFDGRARAYDRAAENSKEEYARKVRTLFGNYQLFAEEPRMLSPRWNPVAFFLWSHKVLRLTVPFLQIVILLSNIFLLESSFFRCILVLQVFFYGAAVAAELLKRKKYGMFDKLYKLFAIPHVFCTLNFAAFMGFVRFVRQSQSVTWDKAREAQ